MDRYYWHQNCMVNCNTGEWCKWSDVEELIKERDALKKFAETRRKQINELLDKEYLPSDEANHEVKK